MKYSVIKIIFLCVSLSIFTQTFGAMEAPEKPLIISREEWWADESFTQVGSSHWQEIFEKRASYVAPYRDPAAAKKSAADYQKSLNYINANFAENYRVTQTLRYDLDGWPKLAWPMKYTDQVNAIVVHHTDTEYEDSEDGIHNIHKFHSLSRQWGDIGYNYIIWYNGEIYEGRKWGKYVAAAHSQWNNYSTVGISIMGNYNDKAISEAQYKSLESMIQYLTWEYGIDLSDTYYYNTACSGSACDDFPLETYRDYTLVWHRDTGHTSCPWDMLYEQIEQIRLDNVAFTKWFSAVKRGEEAPESREVFVPQTPRMQQILKLLDWYSSSELQEILAIVDTRLETEKSEPKRQLFQMVKIGILSKIR